MTKHAVIIGSGIGGIGSACLLAQAGYRVTVLEKNEQIGGRMSVLKRDGFTFDMGPSWYLMPDVFEHFFALLGERVQDHLQLTKLAPSYRIFFPERTSPVDIYSDLVKDLPTFESLEPGCTPRIHEYLNEAARKYDISMQHFLYRNVDRLRDFIIPELAKQGKGLNMIKSMDRYTKGLFTSSELRQILQYTLVFLGNSPQNCPSLYSIMTHIDVSQGVYYPQGGLNTIVQAIQKLARARGVEMRTHAEVAKISVKNGKADGVLLQNGERIEADIVISNADRHWTDTQLLPTGLGTTTERYWRKAVLAPSAQILYLGVRGKCESLTHHNFIFARNWDEHFSTIFDSPRWPNDPSVYVCAPSRTDPTVAPSGHENLFVLIPIASGFERPVGEQEEFEDRILAHIATRMNIPDLQNRIVVRQRFSVQDFRTRYFSVRGTALGLAHTLRQTSLLRPNNWNKRVQNLYYVGGNTVPGIGMPICLIGAELVLKRVLGNRSGGPLPTPLHS